MAGTYRRDSVCKYRSVFFLSGKCQACVHKENCLHEIKQKWGLRCTLILILLITVIGLANVFGSFGKSSEDGNMSIADNSGTDKVEQSNFDVLPSSTLVPVYVPKYQFTFEEQLALGKMVLAEAENQVVELSQKEIDKLKAEGIDPETVRLRGLIAVAAVPINRLESRRAEFDAENGNILEVVNKPYAFATNSNMKDEIFMNHPMYEDCMKAVYYAMCGVDPTEEHFGNGGARFFYSLVVPLSSDAAAARENLDIYVIGDHAFHFDFKKRQ